MCDAHVMFPTSSADFTCVTFVFPCGPTCVAPITDPEQFPFQPGPQFLQAWQQRDCGIIFNEVPEDVDQVALVVTDAQTGEQYRVEQGADGWQLSADGSRADLMGLTCDEALNGRFSTISFEFGCTDVPVLR